MLRPSKGPPRRGGGHADLPYVFAATKTITAALDDFTVVINKSTAPVGTDDEVELIICETNPGAEFTVVSNPEFLREGAAIKDFKRPDHVVIEIEEPRAREVMDAMYSPLSLNAPPLVFVSRRTSELANYAGNVFLATKITFINEIADLCEKVGADVQDVARGIGLDERIDGKFLNAGLGFGGSCFPKDTLALNKTGKDEGSSLRIVETLVAVNNARRVIVALGGSVHADDPQSMVQARTLMPEVIFHAGADTAAIVTECDAFRALDLDREKSLLKWPIIVDLRNVYRAAEVRRFGFIYVSLGRSWAIPDSRQNPKIPTPFTTALSVIN